MDQKVDCIIVTINSDQTNILPNSFKSLLGTTRFVPLEWFSIRKDVSQVFYYY